MDHQHPYIIGIAGGSASGKSHLLKSLKTAFPDQLSILSLDDFYRPLEQQQKDQNGIENFDLPESIDKQRFVSMLEALCGGQSVQLADYSFNNPDKKEKTYKTIQPAPVLLVEGLFVFHEPAISTFLDLTVFLHADDHVRLDRRMKRDTTERGITPKTVEYQWENHVMPSHQLYLEPYKIGADIVFNTDSGCNIAFQFLSQFIRHKIEWQASLQ